MYCRGCGDVERDMTTPYAEGARLTVFFTWINTAWIGNEKTSSEPIVYLQKIGFYKITNACLMFILILDYRGRMYCPFHGSEIDILP